MQPIFFKQSHAFTIQDSPFRYEDSAYLAVTLFMLFWLCAHILYREAATLAPFSKTEYSSTQCTCTYKTHERRIYCRESGRIVSKPTEAMIVKLVD